MNTTPSGTLVLNWKAQAKHERGESMGIEDYVELIESRIETLSDDDLVDLREAIAKEIERRDFYLNRETPDEKNEKDLSEIGEQEADSLNDYFKELIDEVEWR